MLPTVGQAVPSDRTKRHHLSASQRLMLMVQDAELFAHQGFVIPALHRVTGPLSVPALQAAIRLTAKRHGSLRSRLLRRSSGAARLVVDSELQENAIRYLDVSNSNSPRAEGASAVQTVYDEPLDLAQQHPLRVLVVRISEQEHLVAICVHHLVADGWSIDILLKDVSRAYEGFLGGDAQLPRARQHSDFQLWEAVAEKQGDFDAGLKFWAERLTGIRPLPLLPTRQKGEGCGANLRRSLSSTASDRLKEFCRAHRATPFMVTLAALKFLLATKHDQEDVTIATQMSNRLHSEADEILGYLANTVLLRTALPRSASFGDAVLAVRSTCLQAARHQAVPFLLLVENLGLSLLGFSGSDIAGADVLNLSDGSTSFPRLLKDMKRDPMLVFQYSEPAVLELAGCDARPEAAEQDLQTTLDATPLDIHVAVVKQTTHFNVYFGFQRGLPAATLAHEFANQYMTTLELTLARPAMAQQELWRALALG
ncbi:MAG TPA: condensation domain-containing protein [Polyangiaceae bacterium]|nr:condensation domain-containing protein [Polyangiaceae bacterium]